MFNIYTFFGKIRSGAEEGMIENTAGRSSQASPRRLIRVIHVGPGWGQRGGIASVLHELTLQREQFDSEGISLSFFETHGFHSLKSALSFVIFDLPRFALALMRGTDVVHFHVSVRGSFYRKLVLCLLARLFGCKTIFHLHAGNFTQFESGSGKLTRRAVAWFVQNAQAAVAVSTAIGEEMRALGVDSKTLHVIGNTARHAEAAVSVLFDRTAEDSGAPYIAFAGRLTEAKGIAELFKAIALLKKEECFVELRLAGGGDIAYWQKVARDCGIDDRVTFVGWLTGDEKLSFYRSARVFCMPSHYESFGITTLEAMFSGIPVVGSRLGGFLDLVDEGVTGYLVEPRAPEALADRLRVVFENSHLAQTMGRAGLKKAQRYYSSDAIIDQYVHCYRNVVSFP